MNVNRDKAVLSYLLALNDMEHTKDLSLAEKIRYIANSLNYAEDEVKKIILTNEFVNRYQQAVLSKDRLEHYEEALQKQTDLMRNARSERVQLDASVSIIARADAEFYRKEWEEMRKTDSGLMQMLNELKKVDDNE